MTQKNIKTNTSETNASERMTEQATWKRECDKERVPDELTTPEAAPGKRRDSARPASFCVRGSDGSRSVRRSLKKAGLCMLLGIAMCLLLCACGAGGTGSGGSETDSEQQPVNRDFFAMDTYMTVTAYGDQAAEATEAAETEVYRLDQLLSTGDSGSEISKLNSEGRADLSPEVGSLVQEGLALYDETDHRFDIAIYPVMEAWGFTDKKYRVPSDQELKRLLKLTDADQVSCAATDAKAGDAVDADTEAADAASDTGGAPADADAEDPSAEGDASGDAADADGGYEVSFGKKGMAIDLGGIAKGYTSSRIMEVYKEHGITSGLVSLGGNVQLLGTKPDGSNWRVAIQDPADKKAAPGTPGTEYMGVLEAADTAVITSGAYERNFTKDGNFYHHIIDPATGKPADSGLKSVTIICPDGTLADALSTSLYIMGKDDALEYWRSHKDRFNCVLLDEDDEVYVTEPVADRFSTEKYHVNVVE